MVSSPVQNISDFLKNKPPLVVFLLCLVALAVSTFYFAFEIEKDGSTENSDKMHDWSSMRKHLNTLDTCINFSPWTDEVHIREVDENIKTEQLVFTTVTIEDVNSLKPFSQIDGTLSLQGWYSTTCQDDDKIPKNIEILFDVPTQIKNLNGSLEVCVTIKGPAEFLPLLKTNLPCKSEKNRTSKVKKAIKGFLASKLPRIVDSKFCAEGKVVKMKFDMEEYDIDNNLSDDVRTEIYIHLMWCSYFLVFVVFSILLYAILKKPEYVERKEQSVRLL